VGTNHSGWTAQPAGHPLVATALRHSTDRRERSANVAIFALYSTLYGLLVASGLRILRLPLSLRRISKGAGSHQAQGSGVAPQISNVFLIYGAL
jgi:hypothetical protein